MAVATDGEDALRMLQTMKESGTSPSLILTDINMPVMDGLTFIGKVKDTEFKFLPILVLTTESERGMIEKGKQAGASGWLIKPFHPEQLLWAIKKLMWTK